ncbi:MAG: cupin-like domain-containing protein [Woeseiaceae bacterium]
MNAVRTPIREVNVIDASQIFEAVAAETGPVVFRGLVDDWPLVMKSEVSNADSRQYLLNFYKDASVTAFVSETDIGGRIFYTDELADTNFKQIKTGLDQLLEQLREHEDDPSPPTVYMGSMALDYCLPGLRENNSLAAADVRATVRIWIGNRTTVAAHYDVLENIACVCAGRRRFTLFPPDQLANLYVGPIDFTPAGQSISLVDLDEPDLVKYPRFAQALEHAQTAVLEPGDAIYIPSMWWHHVQGLESFNILINHWWRDTPAFLGAPGDALLHAILSIRDLPGEQREAWKLFFDHYVFSAGAETSGHIPSDKRGALGELDEDAARKIRALLRNKLNR